MDAVIWGFIGTIVGALASILTTLLVSWNNRWLQRDANRFEREENRKNFQRENLMKLQQALMDSMRLAVRAHLEDTKYFRNNPGSEKPGLIDEDLSNEMMISIQELNRLTQRVDDDSLRNLINSLRVKICDINHSSSEKHSQSLLLIANDLFSSVQNEIGVLLRNNQ